MWVECLFLLWPWLSQLIFFSGYWKQLLSTHDQIYQSKRNIWSIHGKKSSWNARKSRNWFKQVLKHVSYFVRLLAMKRLNIMNYCRVVSCELSRLEPHTEFYRLLKKGNFDAMCCDILTKIHFWIMLFKKNLETWVKY